MRLMLSGHLESYTHRLAKWAGSPDAFLLAFASILLCVFIGIFYSFSLAWENALTIYISTVTFLMIFVFQRSQNKELSTLHVKLNELIVSSKHADNRMINVEALSEQEISKVQETHRQIVTDEAR